MKIFNDLRLELDHPNWSVGPELALIDTILNKHLKLYEIVAEDINESTQNSKWGRQDSPTESVKGYAGVNARHLTPGRAR